MHRQRLHLADADGDADHDPDPHADVHADANADANADVDPNPHSHHDADVDPDQDSDPHPDGDADQHPVGDADGDSDQHPVGHAHRDANQHPGAERWGLCHARSVRVAQLCRWGVLRHAVRRAERGLRSAKCARHLHQDTRAGPGAIEYRSGACRDDTRGDRRLGTPPPAGHPPLRSWEASKGRLVARISYLA